MHGCGLRSARLRSVHQRAGLIDQAKMQAGGMEPSFSPPFRYRRRSRSKAAFRVLREALGVSQPWIAKRCGVSPLTVARWEDAGRPRSEPCTQAWEMLEQLWKQIDQQSSVLIRDAVRMVSEAKSEGREPKPVPFIYYRTAADYRQAGHTGSWRVQNAAIRLAVDRLHMLGVPFTIDYYGPIKASADGPAHA